VVVKATKAWAVQGALCALALLIALALLLASGAARPASGQEADEGEGREDAERSDRGEVAREWRLKYQETFGKTLPEDDAAWVLDDYSDPLDAVTDDNSSSYYGEFGSDWAKQINSFDTYLKEFSFGRDGWLTASLSARDSSGGEGDSFALGKRPSISSEVLPGAGRVAKLDVPSHTGGAIIRSTEPLPEQYRIEYDLKTLDFGGERNGTLTYDGRHNGFSEEGCKTRHPWNGPRSSAAAPYCDWPDLRRGRGAYNGFHFLSIVDYDDPVPRNNPFYHYHRKVLMDAFNIHPDRDGRDGIYRVCNSETGNYYPYGESTRNTINMVALGEVQGTRSVNPTRFASSCSNGEWVEGREAIVSAAEMQPELMPKEDYTFAVERDGTGYTLEIAGNFKHVGEQTYRFHHDFIEGNEAIWHYNNAPEDYDGRFNVSVKRGGIEYPDQWPAGSAYPDYFVLGDVYTNAYEGKASVDDIRLYVPKDE